MTFVDSFINKRLKSNIVLLFLSFVDLFSDLSHVHVIRCFSFPSSSISSVFPSFSFSFPFLLCLFFIFFLLLFPLLPLLSFFLSISSSFSSVFLPSSSFLSSQPLTNFDFASASTLQSEHSKPGGRLSTITAQRRESRTPSAAAKQRCFHGKSCSTPFTRYSVCLKCASSNNTRFLSTFQGH